MFTAGTPLTARVFMPGGPAPTLAGAVTTSAFDVGNTVGPWLGGAVIDAGWGYRAPAAVGAVVVLAALGIGVLSRSRDRRPVDAAPAPAAGSAVPERCAG